MQKIAKKANFLSSIARSKPQVIAFPNIAEKIKEFPTTRYYGSKRKLLPWIYESTKGLKYQSVLDVFGGTASVSLLFKALDKNVTYNDGLKSNQLIANAVLSNSMSVAKVDFEATVNNVTSQCGFISQVYKGMYYTDKENAWLDGFCSNLLQSKLTNMQRSVFFYCLAQACLKKRPFNLFHRANLNLRLNKTVTPTDMR